MADFLYMDLVEKRLVTDQIVLNVGYDVENLSGGGGAGEYVGEIKIDRYGRKVPKEAHGSQNLDGFTSSTKILVEQFDRLFVRIADEKLLVRRLNLCASHTLDERRAAEEASVSQMSFFDDEKKTDTRSEEMKKERKRQEAVLEIRKKYGKNAVLKGMNYESGATGKQRNDQIGGHKA